MWILYNSGRHDRNEIFFKAELEGRRWCDRCVRGEWDGTESSRKKKLLPTGWYWWLDTNAHTNSFEFSVNSTIYTYNCIDLNWCFFTNVCAAFFTYRTRNFSSTHFTINSKILWTCVCVCAASVDTSYKNALRHASIFSARNLIQNAIFIRLLVSAIKYLCLSVLNHLEKKCNVLNL